MVSVPWSVLASQSRVIDMSSYLLKNSHATIVSLAFAVMWFQGCNLQRRRSRLENYELVHLFFLPPRHFPFCKYSCGVVWEVFGVGSERGVLLRRLAWLSLRSPSEKGPVSPQCLHSHSDFASCVDILDSQPSCIRVKVAPLSSRAFLSCLSWTPPLIWAR